MSQREETKMRQQRGVVHGRCGPCPPSLPPGGRCLRSFSLSGAGHVCHRRRRPRPRRVHLSLPRQPAASTRRVTFPHQSLRRGAAVVPPGVPTFVLFVALHDAALFLLPVVSVVLLLPLLLPVSRPACGGGPRESEVKIKFSRARRRCGRTPFFAQHHTRRKSKHQ